MSEWISVEDKLPEKTLSLLIFNGSFIDIGCFFCDEYFITDKGSVLDVTHWMPLPEPPK